MCASSEVNRKNVTKLQLFYQIEVDFPLERGVFPRYYYILIENTIFRLQFIIDFDVLQEDYKGNEHPAET